MRREGVGAEAAAGRRREISAAEVARTVHAIAVGLALGWWLSRSAGRGPAGGRDRAVA